MLVLFVHVGGKKKLKKIKKKVGIGPNCTVANFITVQILAIKSLNLY